MEQFPTPARVTIFAATVQTDAVVEAKLTVRPELAVAVSVIGVLLKATLLSGPNVIVSDAGLTVKAWVTGVAAAKLALPAWLAVMEHDPAATIVTVLPATVQTAVVVEVKLTGRPELAVALTGNGAAPNVTLFRTPKVIVCDPPLTLKL
jgi:hypothetical protein